METKKCIWCKLFKSLDDFNKNKGKKDGLNTICRVCSKEYSKSYYKNNSETQKIMINNSRKIRKNETRDYIYNFLLNNPCKECGEKDPIVLEFNHIDQATKISAVTELMCTGYSLKTIKKEIEKCEVLCANCHRRKTAKQLGWYRFNKVQ